MRTLRLALVVTVIVVLLGGLSLAAVAQDEAAPATGGPHRVSGTLREVDIFQGATVSVDEGRYLERGLGTYDNMEMDDARLSGTLWYVWNVDYIKGRQHGSEGEVMTGAIKLVNVDGSWVGTMRGFGSMDPKMYHLAMELTGAGAHDGFSALLYATRPPSGAWDVEGFVFPGVLPEYPDPVEVPSE